MNLFGSNLIIIVLFYLFRNVDCGPSFRGTPVIKADSNPSDSALYTLNLPSNATSIRTDITDNFSCENKTYGYYADIENECQIFHVCLPVMYPDDKERTFRWSFICPDETAFSQQTFTCIREDDFPEDCSESEKYYDLNRNFGLPSNDSEESDIKDDNSNMENNNEEDNRETENRRKPEVQTMRHNKINTTVQPKGSRQNQIIRNRRPIIKAFENEDSAIVESQLLSKISQPDALRNLVVQTERPQPEKSQSMEINTTEAQINNVTSEASEEPLKTETLMEIPISNDFELNFKDEFLPVSSNEPVSVTPELYDDIVNQLQLIIDENKKKLDDNVEQPSRSRRHGFLFSADKITK